MAEASSSSTPESTVEPTAEPAAPTERTAAVATFPCGRCGAELAFAPGTTALSCAHCGHANELEPDERPVVEFDFRKALARIAEAAPTDEHTLVRCGGCGAETDAPPNLSSFDCPYCGSNLVSEQSTRRVIRPRSLLPFFVDEDGARTALRNWIAGLWFAPSKLKKRGGAGDRLRGVYVPFWTYDSLATTAYTGSRGEDYWETQTYTVTRNGKTETRTRQVRKTRWYGAEGVVRDQFDDVLVAATATLPGVFADKLEPWDLDALVPYRDEFLAGFAAELYQVDLPEGFERAKADMDPVIRQTVCRDIGGDRQRIDTMSTRHDEITYKHLLLPVWLTSFRYGGKVHRLYVNARTGEVHGTRPWSFWKITTLVLIIIAAIALVGLLALVFGR